MREPRILLVGAGEDVVALLPSLAPRGALFVHERPGEHEEGDFDAVVADLETPELCDLARLQAVHRRRPEARIVAVCSRGDAAAIASMIRQKAYALLIRPLTAARLRDAIELALAAQDWRDDLELISGSPQWLQLRLRCKMQAAERSVQIFRELQGDLPPDEHEELATAFREMLMNGIEHGGQSDPRKSIWVNYVATNRALVFYIRDPGPGFSMKGLKHAAVGNPEGTLEHAEERERQGIRPGGFGILLAKNMVDELIYSERGNEVILIKHRK
jgi:anti-sigma regulatory factor (Ser/Thr protein kinase)/CheY-like chemotaxis protein